MAYPSAHHLLSFGGTLPGDESWTMGLRLAGIGSPDQAAELALATTVSEAMATKWATMTSINGVVRLAWLKLNKIGVDGKYANGWTTRVDYTAPGISSGNGSSQYPNQVSLVASLTTNTARGLAHQGRLYFPIPSPPVVADGRISAGEALEALNQITDFLDVVNAASGGSVIVASKERSGDQHTVTGVRVGRVLDTMRSRRTSLAEEYQNLPTDAAGWAGGGGPF